MSKGIVIVTDLNYPGEPTIFKTNKTSEGAGLYVMPLTGYVPKLDNKLLYSLKDDGNGYIFYDQFNNQSFRLSYCQAEGLRILFRLHEGSSKTLKEYFE